MRFEANINMNIPKHWKVVKIEEIGKVVGGGTPSTKVPEYFGGDIPWITPKDLSGYNSRYISKGERNITEIGLKNSSAKLMPKNTVLLSSRAPIGYVAIAENEISTNQGFKSVICNNEKINPEYLYYVLKISKKRLESIASGTTFKEVSGKKVKEFKIPLPPLNEQNNIISVLSNLDKKIELNNSIISTLEELAQTLFTRWFVDFEFLNEEGKPYKSSGGKMVESKLGMIPEGWTVSSFDKIGNFKNGVNYSRNTLGNTLYKVINVRNVVGEHILLKYDLDEILIDDSKAKGYKLNKGDTVIVRSASPGETCYIDEDLHHYIYSGFCIRFRPLKPCYSLFSYYHLSNLKRELDLYSTGTTLKNLNQKILKSITFALPNENLLSKFENMIMKIVEMMRSFINENEQLIRLRDTLLPKLLSGEIELPDEEEVTELV